MFHSTTAIDRRRDEEGPPGASSRLIMTAAPGGRRPAGLLLAGLLAGLLILPPLAIAGATASDLDWTLGVWEGIRRDGADGSEAPMTMRVEAILGGAGQIRQIEIPHDGGVYRGFAVQVFNEEKGRWVRLYTNEGRGRFSTLEGEVEGDRSTWWVTSVDRPRESRLVSERLEDDRWRRTMSISKDNGHSWTVLWIDELRRR